MDTNSGSTLKLEEHLARAVSDKDIDVLYKLSQIEHSEGSPLELVADLPAAIDPQIILSHVMRWRDIQQHFGCDLRIYAWSYNTEVEKYVLGCVTAMSHLFITILPHWLKEDYSYDE